MKRKTNLFYTSGPDSKFITFSNYTESLTGNFLSLETKLFPDKFLCLKIGGLNSLTKPEFIKYLATYYENKLAMLRDNNIKLNVNVESNILPLAYLIEAIIRICDFDNGSSLWTLNIGKLNNFITNKDFTLNEEENIDDIIDNIKNNSSSLITYIGEVTEQDYNGTYTDTICTIDLNSYNEGEIIITSNEYSTILSCSTDENNEGEHLYGWENDNMIFEDYENAKPIFDQYDVNSKKGTYYYNASIDSNYSLSSNASSARVNVISRIKLKNIDQNNAYNINKSLEFNVIIPLYSLVNKNISHNNWNVFDEDKNESYKYIDLCNESAVSVGVNYIYNVPLGMWIHGDSLEDTFIKIEKDQNLNLYPSWSLLISSQFKPFPYSNKLPEINNSKSMLDAHATYAEVLSKINNLLDEFNSFNIHLKELENKISSMEYNIKNIATENNISNINEKLLSTERRVLDELDDMKRKFYGYINNITWSSAG